MLRIVHWIISHRENMPWSAILRLFHSTPYFEVLAFRFYCFILLYFFFNNPRSGAEAAQNVAVSCKASPERSEWGTGATFAKAKVVTVALSASPHCSALFFLIKNFNWFCLFFVYYFFLFFFHLSVSFVTFDALFSPIFLFFSP